tara:strand:- start:18616 stop:18816 length:201 start_codon:yes stop_codon:yes gene_type:complete
MNDDRIKLKEKLQLKLYDSSMKRKSKNIKQTIVNKNLSTIGIDAGKLKEDLKNVSEQGGLNISYTK